MSNGNVTISVDSPNRYLRMAARLKSWPLIESFFPNNKEITESFSAFHHISQIKGVRVHSSIIYVVGDGVYPRTSSIFALRTTMPVICIDPLLCLEKTKIKRLHLFPLKVQDIKPHIVNFNQAIIVLVHSHAKISDCLHLTPNANRLIIYTLPCCVNHELTLTKFNLKIQPTYRRIDKHVLSPKNEVLIWDIKNWATLAKNLF